MQKKIVLFLIMTGLSVLMHCSYNSGESADIQAGNFPVLTAVPESDPVVLPAPAPLSRWSKSTHTTLSGIAASQWGLTSGRVNEISDASDYPDTYQSGLENGFNQQWSHAYIYDMWFGSVFYLWGDADEDFHDNIDGPPGGEGYNGGYAGYYYGSNQRTGDQYLGYALHYIEDVSLVLHSTAPTSIGLTVPYETTDMLTHHFDFEKWVENNMNSGWQLLNTVRNDYNYYVISDLKQALKNTAWASCAYRGTNSIGYAAWKEYRNCGYPTASGSGTAVLADNTTKMLINAARYAKGAIKYTLDKYGQWSAAY